MTRFEVTDQSGKTEVIEIPSDMGLSLMEVLKASGYDIPATCGGIALCATCHVRVTRGLGNLNASTEAELDMIDTLPDASAESRLACQIRIDENITGARFELRPVE